MNLQPLATSRATTNQPLLLEHHGKSYVVKVYRGARAQERRDYEEHTLQLWQRAGIKVPGVAAIELPELRGRSYLVMDYLEGSTLQECLRHADTPLSSKMGLLGRIFRENVRRHLLACHQGQPALLHPDLNSSNVICCGQEFFFIDLETPIRSTLTDAAAIETAKFCRWVAHDLGVADLPLLMRLLVDANRGNLHLVEPIVTRTLGRPLQWFHVWRDRRRKRTNARDVTKYDVARALAVALRAEA